MANSALLRIVIGEFEEGDSEWEFLYKEIVQTLWNHGISGATVIRTDEGIGEDNEYRAVVLEDIAFNNLPIVIEAVDDKERIEAMLPELKKKIPHGEIVTMQAIRILEEDVPMDDQAHLMLKVYLKEQTHGLKTANYEDILGLFREHELIWSIVMRGIEGFGKDHVIHKQSLFSFSSNVPVVIESVGKAEVIRGLLPKLKEQVQDGLVIAIPVQVDADR
ncbi:DUF190 domain-containing protein [Paenibacillus doosanensis]|uniref:DUF190 domain-containing protein n=1 Tax=Paenibacillus konkukensis TaxID=2020716 RepID=A0ABY4RIT5_9BACL|nr:MULTISPECIES: DUF190 domain-containing protein [Paenibacillus]MCS7461937.1 DUF190 domain-containing protein [Paenibacillus doosanensis]UQZ81448.1 hypothetical protein SK3146_00604 [Paenibacillus konkukensis]